MIWISNFQGPKKIFKRRPNLGSSASILTKHIWAAILGFLENVLMAEELCRKDATMGGALMLAGYGAECLLRPGSRELKEAFIPPVTLGKMTSIEAGSKAIVEIPEVSFGG
jgi:acyl-CoA dehydrogenase